MARSARSARSRPDPAIGKRPPTLMTPLTGCSCIGGSYAWADAVAPPVQGALSSPDSLSRFACDGGGAARGAGGGAAARAACDDARGGGNGARGAGNGARGPGG